MKIPTWQSIPAWLWPASQFISIVDFISNLQVFFARRRLRRCLNRWFLPPHLSVHLNNHTVVNPITPPERCTAKGLTEQLHAELKRELIRLSLLQLHPFIYNPRKLLGQGSSINRHQTEAPLNDAVSKNMYNLIQCWNASTKFVSCAQNISSQATRLSDTISSVIVYQLCVTADCCDTASTD